MSNLRPYEHFEIQRLETQRLRGLIVLHLEGRQLSARSTGALLVDELLHLISQERPPHLLINFARVVHCPSELINALIDVRSMVVGEGGQLRICGLRDETREVFQVLGLDGSLFEIHDSASRAIESFSPIGDSQD